MRDKKGGIPIGIPKNCRKSKFWNSQEFLGIQVQEFSRIPGNPSSGIPKNCWKSEIKIPTSIRPWGKGKYSGYPEKSDNMSCKSVSWLHPFTKYKQKHIVF